MEHIAADIGGTTVHMRPLTGRDQLELGAAAGAGRRLIGRLLDGSGWLVEALSVAQRDRLIAALWRDLYGDRIVASQRCGGCADLFDIDFRLSDLVAALDAADKPEEVAEVLPDGSARLSNGAVIVPLHGADEARIAPMPRDRAIGALRERSVRGDDVDDAVLDRTLAWLDPVIDTELDAVCPECGTAHEIRFSIEHFLISALQGERQSVLRDVDALARNYGWGLAEILGLARSERRLLVAYAEAAAPGTRGQAWS